MIKGFGVSLFFLVILLFSACNPSAESNPNDFLPYINAYSSGIISKTSSIKIELAQELGLSHSLRTPITDDILQSDENLKGTTYWTGSHSLEFKPSSYLDPGKTYHFHFNLSKLIKVPDSLKSFKFKVQTLSPNLEFQSYGLKSYRGEKGRMEYRGTFITADYEDPTEVEKILVPSFGGNKTKITWTHSADFRNHQFTLDSLIRGEKPIPLQISWNGKAIGKDTANTQTFQIPGINEFKVLDARALVDSEQAVLVQFSDPLSKIQDLRGLIELGALNDLRFSLDGSELKIYGGNTLDGNYEFKAHSGIKNQDEKTLGNIYSANIFIESQAPSVSFPGNGVILPSSGKLLVPFIANNLKAVDVDIIKIYSRNIPQFLQTENLRAKPMNEYGGEDELRRVGRPIARKTIRLDEDKLLNLHHKNRFFLDMDKMIRTEPGAIYRVLIAFRKSYAVNICSADSGKSSPDNLETAENLEGDGPNNSSGNVDSENKFWNFYNSGYSEGSYDWTNRDNPCYEAYYTRARWATRNILASNLGIIAKKQDHDRLWIAVNDVLTSNSLSDVDLEVLDYQQNVIASGKTDSKGIAELNPTRKPFLLIAKRGSERGYLKIGDDNALSLSRFDIGGDIVQNGIKGFIYPERDVHRPGDSLYLSFILDDSQNKLPELYPVNFELKNPGGQVVRKTTLTESIDKFYVFKTRTELDAPTGIYTLTVKVGGNTYTQAVRIESIMPNRLKINLDFGGLKQLSAQNHPEAHLNAQWLFGGTASTLKAKTDLSLIQNGPTEFAHFTDFIFDDPTVHFETSTQTVFEGPLDQNGSTHFPLNTNLGTHPPGKLQARFLTKVFEPGGAFSIHQSSIPFVFYSSFVGLKTPKGNEFNGGLLLTDKPNTLDIVRVDENGNLLGQRGQVEIALYKLGWHWWWENNASVESGFLQSKTTQIIKTQVLDLQGGKSQWSFQVAEKDWGRYLVLVKDLNSGHITGKVLYIESPDWESRAMDDNPTEAAMLALNLDKAKYQVGDPVTVNIPTAAGGRCLVSLESGVKTIKTYWVDTKAGQTTFTFDATKEMSPNVYVHVTLLQGTHRKNDLPIRMFGVVPLFVENKETILKPKIIMPNSLKPETKASITVSEEQGKEMTYTLALVDEGLLDITGFETPDPHKSFYSREALGVKTFDMYDEVLGDWSGSLDRILAIGGDAASDAVGKSKKDPVNQVNRFKPVVLFMGPFHLNRGEKKTHTLEIPQYIGALRVMVIAGHERAYGTAEASVQVKKPLMLLATVPRVLAPEEELNLPVTVFGMENWIKKAEVSLAPSDFYEMVGPSSQTVNFPKPGDQLTGFHIKLKNKTGVAKINLIARSGKESASYTLSLAVRNPNPYITQTYPLELSGGNSGSLSFMSFGEPDQATGYLEVSTLPSLNLQKRLAYLVDYPNGCAEQVTSAAFPQLYLNQLGDLSARQKADIDFNIKAALRKIPLYLSPGGGVNYWPGASEPDEWVSSYTGHFILEAKKKGFVIPDGFLTNWIHYQKNLALSWYPRKDNFYGGDLIQAYRLYTLALARAPELGAMNRLQEFKYLSDAAAWRLAAAYALSGNKTIAQKMIRNLSLSSSKPYRQNLYTYGSDFRDQAMKLETLTLLGEKDKARQLLNSVAQNLASESWYSTQETAYALVAIASYCGSNPAPDRVHFKYGTGNATREVSTGSYISTQILPYQGSKADLNIQNLGSHLLYIRVIEKGKPALGEAPEPQNDPSLLSMVVRYENLTGEEINPTQLSQGTDFVALVSLKNTGNKGEYANLALSEIFPSGWEILNSRLVSNPGEETSSSQKSYTLPTYQDIRDDRVLTYFNLGTHETAVFRVFLNATYTGHFYAPGIYCEQMYDASVHAGTSGRWVDILAPGK